MTVIINCRFLSQPISGVQRFAENIVAELARQRADLDLVAPNVELRRYTFAGLPVKKLGHLRGHAWEQIELARYARVSGGLLVCLGNSAPLFTPYKISTLHDVTYRKYPEGYSRGLLWSLRLFAPLMLRSSLKTVTVSEFSRGEIHQAYGTDENDMVVVYNAAASVFVPNLGSRADFFLGVFNSGANKNMEVLRDAFAAMPTRRLLLIGGKAGSSLDGVENIVLLGRVSDSRLAELYHSARAFISSSVYEGFGLPPIEAQASGTPVLASRVPIYEETLGASAVFFDPGSSSSLVDRLSEFDRLDAAEVSALQVAGMRNAERFSWVDSARTLSECIDRVLIGKQSAR